MIQQIPTMNPTYIALLWVIRVLHIAQRLLVELLGRFAFRKGVDDSSIMGRRILTVEISDIIFAMRLQRDKTNATALPADSVYQSTNHHRVSRPSQSGSVGSVSRPFFSFSFFGAA